MANPQEVGLEATRKKDNLSDLMRAKARCLTGEKVNACPYGCDMEDIDDNGYCKHLVGFTNDGKGMEPMVMDDRGRRMVRVKSEITDEGKTRRLLEPVLKTDKLVKITVSSRVYREVAKQSKAS